MGDDPYDFDIAIPSGNGNSYGGGGGGGKRSGWGGRASDSDSDGDANDSASNVSLSSDSDRKPTKKEASVISAQRRSTGGEGGGPLAKAGGGGGSSALDKAKSFLSKYSSKATASTPASASGRSRRLEMSLDDDDDFSLDSSGEATKKPTARRTRASKQRASPSASEHDSDSDGNDASSRDNSGSDEESTRVVAVEKNKPRVVVTNARNTEEESHDSDDEQPMTKSMVVPVTSSTIPTTWRPSKGATPVEDDDEIESIASQSDVDESVNVPKPVSTQVRAVAVTAAACVAVSESGVYEDEDFEEASTNIPLEPVRTQAPVVARAVAESPTKEEESHVQYSLDFVDDTELSPTRDSSMYEKPTTRFECDDDDAHSNASSSSNRNKDSYVEEEESHDEPDEVRETHIGTDVKQEEHQQQQMRVVETHDESEGYSQDDQISSDRAVQLSQPAPVKESEPPMPQKLDTLSLPAVRQSSIVVPAHEVRGSPPPLPPVNETREKVRPRVQIVREYEQEQNHVEKRDASTQFTGNHASIQTDLTPDGMLTGSERRRSREPSSSIAPEPGNELPVNSSGFMSPPISVAPIETRLPEPLAPPPPPSAFANYGLYDPLQLPSATSMSIYKHQLLALQQQIHQKKLETERLFRDRISSRYTSLRGTERFLASNRPPRIPLWEALLRVDPSLGEAKAKEIARMTSDGAA